MRIKSKIGKISAILIATSMVIPSGITYSADNSGLTEVADINGSIDYSGGDVEFTLNGSNLVEKDIKDLKNLGIKPVILSGDKKEIVRDVAKSVGIDTFYGDLLPLDKVSKLENIMENSQGKVAFIGDGTNDAPVLTRADVGISMGSGSDIAIESSDVVLLKDQISKVVETIKISLMTKRIVYENIGLALILKIIILILGALGVATMFLAIFADVGVSLLCIFNSLRLMKA